MPQVSAGTEAELVAAVRAADLAGRTVHVVGDGRGRDDTGGDGDSEALVVRVATTGMTLNMDGCSADDLAFCGGVLATVAAGESWAGFVQTAIEREWVGVECLAGLPGRVGGAVVTNLDAHGQSVADTLASVRTWDRAAGSYRRFAMVDCEFTDGSSRFDRERMPDGTVRYVVLEAAFLFPQGDLSARIGDDELARALGIAPGGRAPMTAVRDAVLAAGEPLSR